MQLSLKDIETMKTEFPEYFEDLFKNEEQKLKVLLELKLRTVKNSDNI